MTLFLTTEFDFRFVLQWKESDQKVRGKVLLNCIAFIDCNENS